MILKSISNITNIQNVAKIHCKDSIWYPIKEDTPVESMELGKALQMQKRNIKTWGNIWDFGANTWFSRAPLIAKFNLTYSQSELIGKRLIQWH